MFSVTISQGKLLVLVLVLVLVLLVLVLVLVLLLVLVLVLELVWKIIKFVILIFSNNRNSFDLFIVILNCATFKVFTRWNEMSI